MTQDLKIEDKDVFESDVAEFLKRIMEDYGLTESCATIRIINAIQKIDILKKEVEETICRCNLDRIVRLLTEKSLLLGTKFKYVLRREDEDDVCFLGEASKIGFKGYCLNPEADTFKGIRIVMEKVKKRKKEKIVYTRK